MRVTWNIFLGRERVGPGIYLLLLVSSWPIGTETCEKSGFDGTYERYMCIANVRSGRSFAKPLVLSKRSSLVWKKKPIVSCFGRLLVVRVDGRMRLRSKAASSPQITPRGHVVLASLHGAHPHFLSIAGQVNSSRNKDLGERQLLSARRALGKYDAKRRHAVADKGT
ncbi:hypothetical protein D6D06_07317 [Aureobasidium pullulans]|nr:hypothetical protein D6D06_07317 [Aureobasidium pullulans]THX77304.1 hypothetical protein D6D05_05821 [Aureobasidium pullulans]